MKTTISIRLKAAFLLTVFALNTVVGFACAMGVDMGFNSPHHAKEPKGKIHIHKDGKRHVHKVAAEKSHHAKAKGTTASKNDDCCKEKVVKLQTADKNFQYAKTSISTHVYILPRNYIEHITFKIGQPHLQEYVACHFHPPPRDIRIDIQSFQI